MSRSLLETLIGGAVLVIAIGFVTFAYSRSTVQTVQGYEITARFDRIDGLQEGGDVRISGIKIGSVISLQLDAKTYQAVARLSIRDDVKLPDDSTAAVVSESLLGGKYVALDPGGSDRNLGPGGAITITQSSLNLESLIGHFIFGEKGKKAE